MKEEITTEPKLIDIYKEARIIRDKYTKSASLKINIPGEWSLFAENIDIKKPIIQGKEKGTYSLPVIPSQRSYFKLITNYGSAVLAEKHLPMEGGYNFRDLGGLESKNGKHLLWGKFFRSDSLFYLTEEDLTYLSGIPITTLVDFRCEEEYTQFPDKLPDSLKNYYNLSIHPGILQTFAKSKISSKEKIVDSMKKLYRTFVTQPEYVNSYREFFRLIQQDSQLPLLFHCSAGKDRTGLAAALLLSALDIPKEIIMNDYMESNLYLKDKYQSLFEQNPASRYLYTSLPDYLEAALEEIDKKYSSITVFLEKELKINTQKLQEKYLF